MLMVEVEAHPGVKVEEFHPEQSLVSGRIIRRKRSFRHAHFSPKNPTLPRRVHSTLNHHFKQAGKKIAKHTAAGIR